MSLLSQPISRLLIVLFCIFECELLKITTEVKNAVDVVNAVRLDIFSN